MMHPPTEVFAINNDEAFTEIALAVYNYQFENNVVYKDYCSFLGRVPAQVKRLADVPFLPVSFFKTHKVVTGTFTPDAAFTSSGTTGATTSTHFVKDAGIYTKSFQTCFERFYGDPGGYCIIGLLPSYLEAEHSSLVFMVDDLIRQSPHAESGFYRTDYSRLAETLANLEARKQQTILFGVTYALVDFATAFPMSLNYTTIIETGGMKGRRREVTKPELYHLLKEAFQLNEVHSEYGMTELLSQAYAVDGLYQCPPWMRVYLRDESDPLSPSEKIGIINVTDLANVHSCSFIATDDRGRLHLNGRFEVLGRRDHSDIRGCSQLLS